jgi:RND family efflux transporter MFP subunit
MQKTFLLTNPPLHPSQEGNQQPALQTELPSSEGLGVDSWAVRNSFWNRELSRSGSRNADSPVRANRPDKRADKAVRAPTEKRQHLIMRTFFAQLLLVAFQIGIQSAHAQDNAWVAGLTEPIHDITLSSPVIGIVGARPVEEGAFVKKGQVLIELDKSLEELEVSRKRLIQDLAKIEFDRTKTLSDKKAISVSREEMDKKQTEFSIATVEHELAKEQLRKRLLTAPIDGFVTEIFLEVGEGCETRQPVVRLVDTRRCYFIANVEAKLGHSLKTGQKLKLQIETGALPADVEGTISFVSPVVDPASGLMKVKLTFENPDAKIRPGVAGRMLVKP